MKKPGSHEKKITGVNINSFTPVTKDTRKASLHYPLSLVPGFFSPGAESLE